MKVSGINFMDFTSVSHVHYLSHFEFQYLTVLQQDQFCALSLLTGFDSGITRLFLKVDETLSKSFFLLESSSALFFLFLSISCLVSFILFVATSIRPCATPASSKSLFLMAFFSLVLASSNNFSKALRSFLSLLSSSVRDFSLSWKDFFSTSYFWAVSLSSLSLLTFLPFW